MDMTKKKKNFFIIPMILALLGIMVFISLEAAGGTINPNVEGLEGMVSTAHPLASLAASEILLRGGNAIDAAVAAAFAVSVAEAGSSGIGGGGFIVYFEAAEEKFTVFDFREVAPMAATSDMYIDEAGELMYLDLEFPMSKTNSEINRTGHLAAGVPGFVAGHLYALENYGLLSRETVLAPAIRFAEEGVVITPSLAGGLEGNFSRFMNFPASKEIFIKDGLPYEAGDILYQKDLANTLKVIAQKGVEGFYQGPIAEAIAREMEENEGLITLEDLANYPNIRPRVLEPAMGTYRDYTIASMCPPSSGGTHVIQQLNMLENFDISSLGHNSAQTLHVIIEVFKRAFADRAAYMGDPAFIDVPVDGLTSKEYAKKLAESICMDTITDYYQLEPGDPFPYQDVSSALDEVYVNLAFGEESPNTTHISVIDGDGNMVALTQTLMSTFGCGVTVPGTGIVLNNQPQNFTPIPGYANSVAPGKTPLSSMSPTVMIDPDGRPILTVGSPGGTGIFGTVTQIIMNIVDHRMGIQEAIEAPRLRVSPYGPLLDRVRILLEEVDPEVFLALEAMGYEVELYDGISRTFGGAQGVYVDYDSERLVGGADPRRAGRAIGY